MRRTNSTCTVCDKFADPVPPIVDPLGLDDQRFTKHHWRKHGIDYDCDGPADPCAACRPPAREGREDDVGDGGV